MNILIAGNGLDLHHGNKTGYIDFLKYAKKQGWDSNCFIKDFIVSVEADGVPLEDYNPDEQQRKWIDCEDEIKIVIQAFIEAIVRQEFDDSDDVQIKVYKCFEPILCDGGVGDFHLYYDNSGIFHKDWLIRRLREELDEAISLLRQYLTKDSKASFTFEPFTKTKFDYAISFNYTDKVELYINNLKNVYYLHGSLEKDNMVFGSFNVGDIDFVYFEKYFQRIQKKTDWFDVSGINKINGITNHFYGCSFGESDTDIMRELLREDLLKYEERINNVIYYYGQTDYEEKVVNLIKILGKENFVRWYYSGKIQFIDVKSAV